MRRVLEMLELTRQLWKVFANVSDSFLLSHFTLPFPRFFRRSKRRKTNFLRDIKSSRILSFEEGGKRKSIEEMTFSEEVFEVRNLQNSRCNELLPSRPR